MSFFARQNKIGGFADVIRCDQPDYLIWKWHPSGAAQGTLKRETAIRTNSVLRVKEGEVAVFVYKQKDGTNQDFIVGPYDETLKTKNFPILSSIIGLWYEGDTLSKLRFSLSTSGKHFKLSLEFLILILLILGFRITLYQ